MQRWARTWQSPGQQVAGNRLLLLIMFWWLLVVSVALWWFNTSANSVMTPAGAVTAVGRITGMVAGFLLLTQLILMSRIAWLEDWIGAHDLLRWHRRLGGYVLAAVLAHTGFIIVGYAMTDKKSVFSETTTMLTTLGDIVSAFVATGILVLVGMLAIRAIRRRMRYELWYIVHLTTYAVVVLAYGHQFADGNDLGGGFASWYWTGLYALTLACLVWGRVVDPLWVNLRHRFRVVAVNAESRTMFSIYIGGRNLDRLQASAGQYFRWRFLNRNGWWQAHPFSLSAAPNRYWLRLTVSAVGDHTRELGRLRPGTRVFAEGPSGAFTADRQLRPQVLLIAGGSGIAPIRALLEVLPPGSLVIYRASDPNDVVFDGELRTLAQRRGIGVHYAIGSRHDPSVRQLFTPEGLRALVPDVRLRDVYLCGPQGLVSAATAVLDKLQVPRRQIHLDPFEF